MKLSDYTLQELTHFIKGDDFAPYRNGQELVKLFNRFGARDVYDNGLPDIGKKNGQKPSRKEYVKDRLKKINGKPELREMLTFIFNELESKDKHIDKLNQLLKDENYHIEQDKEGNIIIIGGIIDRSSPPNNQAHFEEIEEIILRELDKAEVSIWVAVAWFTNEKIFSKLLEKQGKGIDVRVLTFKDGVNSKYGVDLSKINKYYSKRSKRGGIMHNKFCIIDNQVVLTGSYNWTNNAEFKNNENITVQKDPKQATKYSVEFKKLINS